MELQCLKHCWMTGTEEDFLDSLKGSNGNDGDSGNQSLIKTTVEAAGDNCANGGIKIESGIDSNADGTLDDDEVDSFVISDAVSYTYEWFGTSFVIPDEKVHKLGIKVEDTGSVSLDAMRLAFGAEPTLNASFDATDTEQFRDAPYITLHALVYEVNSNLLFDDVNDALPIYSIIKSSDIKADDWYNFDLSPLPWRSPLPDTLPPSYPNVVIPLRPSNLKLAMP